MKLDWKDFCQCEDFRPVKDGVEVRLTEVRGQKVVVEDCGDMLALRSMAASPTVLKGIPDAALQAWIRNRTVVLAGFRIDARGWMVGEVLLPKESLNAGMFQFAVRHLALESDRYEFQLSGQDRE